MISTMVEVQEVEVSGAVAKVLLSLVVVTQKWVEVDQDI